MSTTADFRCIVSNESYTGNCNCNESIGSEASVFASAEDMDSSRSSYKLVSTVGVATTGYTLSEESKVT